MLSIYIVAAFAVSAVIATPLETSSQGLCLTKTCIVTAANLMRSMNTTVDPCEDFYEYACGKWIKSHPVPYWKSEWAVFYKMRDDVFYHILDILNAGHQPHDPEAVRKVKDMYTACMDEDTINSRNERPMMPILRSLGGWPVLESRWDESRFDIIDTMVKLNDIGLQPLFKHGVWTGYKKADWRTYFFQLDQPDLDLKRAWFTDSRYSRNVDLLKTFAKDMARMLGSRATDIDQQMDDMVDFEAEMAKLTATDNERKDWDQVYQKMTIDEFRSRNTHVFDIVKYVNKLMTLAGTNERAKYYTKIINWGKPSFWKGLGELINRTPKKTVANYLIFNVIYNTVGYLSDTKFRDVISRFVTPIWGAPNYNQRRDSICSWAITQDHGWAIGRMFIDKHFTPVAKKTASSMIEDIRTIFIGMLSKVSWMDRTAQQAAVAKARAIKKCVGYPEAIANDSELNKMYALVHATGRTYYENTISTWTWSVRTAYLNFGKKVDRSAWTVMPTVVNAFYEPTLNRISIPAAILQVPFYHKDYPKYLNFAGIGYIIGHELTHGFDNSGKEFDLNGEERQWWSPEVIAKYTKKAKCFVKQYNNYYVPEVKRYVNGELTLNENLADNGGILESFRAYRAYVQRLGKEEDLLPGIGLNSNQLFYLNAAQIWCGKVITDGAWDWDLKEVHAPMRYRIWGSMQNSPEFHKTFNCARGTHMNPTSQCQMW